MEDSPRDPYNGDLETDADLDATGTDVQGGDPQTTDTDPAAVANGSR